MHEAQRPASGKGSPEGDHPVPAALLALAPDRRIVATGGMAIAAIHGNHAVSDIRRVDKPLHLRPRPDIRLLLSENSMAEITIFGNDFPLPLSC